MPRTPTSPGVYLEEIDKSFLPPSFPTPGAVFIGLTETGPAFEPIIVDNYNDFITIFGEGKQNSFLRFAVRNYLKHGPSSYIIRVLGTATASATVSGSTNIIYYGLGYETGGNRYLLAEIFSQLTMSLLENSTTNNFSLAVTQSNGTVEVYQNLSFNEGSPNFIGNVLNTNPLSNNKYYVKGIYSYRHDNVNEVLNIFSSTARTFGQYDVGDNLVGFTPAETTYIISNPVGNQRLDLFKIYTLDHGTRANTKIKVSIANISMRSSNDYCTFDVLVRKFDDTDENPIILESFTKVNLDPNSENFILSRIGDQYKVWNSVEKRFIKYGNYPVKSKYIRVSLNENIADFRGLYPVGFRVYPVQVVKSGAQTYKAMPLPTMSENDVTSTQKYFGVNFKKRISDALSPSISHSVDTNSVYSLEGVSYFSTVNITNPLYTKWRKFTLPLHRGFDGLDPSSPVNYSSLPQALVNGFKDAVYIAGSPEIVDAKDLFIPGVSDPNVLGTLVDVLEERQDIFAVIDTSGPETSISQQINNVEPYDTSFAATYYPWVKVYDPITNDYFVMPPSVAAAEVIAFNDKVAFPWYAPAGFSRGSISSIITPIKLLYSDDRDFLLQNNINPIAKFPGYADPVIWGQKTLQKRQSALDSINVRRLVVHIKKFINEVARKLIFEMSNPDTWNLFKSELDPFLNRILNNRGIKEYKVIMDETINTPDVIDRNIVKGIVAIVPQMAAEIIMISFTVDRTSSSVSFE